MRSTLFSPVGIAAILNLAKSRGRASTNQTFFAGEASAFKLQQAAATFECIYTNVFTSKVSRGLDKPIPKPLGQDKPRLELALG